MRSFMLRLLGLLFIAPTVLSGQYFQQKIAYDINASIDSNHLISATCDISYTNQSSSELDTIFLHLWQNAFKDRLSAFSEQMIRIGDLNFYYANDDELGGYNNLIVSMDGIKMELYSWQRNKDVVYFLPSKPLKPEQSVTIETSYDLQLPRKMSRTGWTTYDEYLMYWHPTPAVYDTKGWHPMPYLAMGESYTEVANYNIELTTDSESIIASSPFTKQGNKYFFSAENIIDFAAITSKNKTVYTHKLNSNGKNPIALSVMTKSPKRDSSIVAYLQDALNYLEPLIGSYPYSTLAVMDKGIKAKSGMEYPGLITVSGEDKTPSNLRYYLVHELLHQYFYSALAFNQRSYAWLDEGLTTYFQQRYYKELLGFDHYSSNSELIMFNGQQPLLHSFARGQACRHHHASLSTHIDDTDPINYGLNAYEIPARMYAHLADYCGTSNFDIGIQTFYQNWKEKHPQPKDLQQALETASGKNLSWFFNELIIENWAYDYEVESLENGVLTVNHANGSTPPYKVTFLSDDGNEKQVWIEGHTGTNTYDIKDQKWTKAILDKENLSMDLNTNNNSVNVKRPLKISPLTKIDDGRYIELMFVPTLSYNTSDGGMLGLALYNSSFPPKKLKWAISPGYGFASSSPVGQAWLSYDQYLKNDEFRKLNYRIGAKSYSFRNSEPLESSLQYIRISPEVSLHFKHANRNQKSSKVYLQSVFLNEEYFDYQEEEFSIKNRNSTLYRLGYEYTNGWNLGPYSFLAELEHQPYTNIVGESHQYTKLTASLEKSFKYAPSLSIDFRLWGAYFLSNSQRESASYDGGFTKGSSALIYQGFNDYAYDDYFFNRANQGVRLSNQTSNAGGGFKTPLGSQYNLGLTNDLAFALNIKSDLPIKMPRLFPLKLFLDVGYAKTKSTFESPITGTTMYSGGVMLEFIEGLFSIYLPMVNSQVISDIYNIEGKGLLGKVSFRIDLHKFNPWQMLDEKKL